MRLNDPTSKLRVIFSDNLLSKKSADEKRSTTNSDYGWYSTDVYPEPPEPTVNECCLLCVLLFGVCYVRVTYKAASNRRFPSTFSHTVCSCRIIHYSLVVVVLLLLLPLVAVVVLLLLLLLGVMYCCCGIERISYIARNLILYNIGSSSNLSKHRSPIQSTPDPVKSEGRRVRLEAVKRIERLCHNTLHSLWGKDGGNNNWMHSDNSAVSSERLRMEWHIGCICAPSIQSKSNNNNNKQLEWTIEECTRIHTKKNESGLKTGFFWLFFLYTFFAVECNKSFIVDALACMVWTLLEFQVQ